MRLFLLHAVGLTLCAQSTEPFRTMGGFLKGNDYPDLNPQQRAAWAAGFVNGMSVAALVVALQRNEGGSGPASQR